MRPTIVQRQTYAQGTYQTPRKFTQFTAKDKIAFSFKEIRLLMNYTKFDKLVMGPNRFIPPM